MDVQPVTPPTSPDSAVIAKAVQDQFDRERGYLKFAEEQADRDRAYFKHLFDRAVWFLGILILACGIFLWRSVDQLRDDVKASADLAVKKAERDVEVAVELMKATAEKELDGVRAEVRQRVADEFEAEQITTLVRSVAKERSEREFQAIIRSETSQQVAKGIKQEAPTIRKAVQDETKQAVRELQPTISGIVEAETKAQVDKSVAQIQEQLRVYGSTIKVANWASLAKSDDRSAFDHLLSIATGLTPASEEEKRIAVQTVQAVIREKDSIMSMSYSFPSPHTPASLKEILQTSKFANDRMAAITSFPDDDRSILPLLVDVMAKDESLGVINTAFRKFNAITQQRFRFPFAKDVLDWWEQNKAKFQ